MQPTWNNLRQSLPRWIHWIGWVGFALFVALVLSISKGLVLPSFERIEDADVRQNTKRGLELLGQRQDMLARTVVTFAFWDDTYSYAQNLNPKYIESNFTASILQTLALNFVVYLDPKGKERYSLEFDPTQKATKTLELKLKEHLNPKGLLRLEKTGVDGLLKLNNRIYLVSSRPILNSHAEGPPRGVLVMGRLLDKALLDELSQSLNLPLELKESSSGEDFQEKHLSFERVEGSATLKDIYGQSIGHLSLIQPRTITRQGRHTIGYMAASFVLLGFLSVVGLQVLLGRFLQSQRQRLHLEQRYRAVVEQASEGMVLVSPNTLEILEGNASMRRILGSESLPKKLSDVLLLDTDELTLHIQQTLKQGQMHWGEQKARDGKGTVLDVEVSASQINHSSEAFILVVLRDIRSRKSHQAQIEQMAYHDALTGLANRRQLQERTAQTLAIAERESWPLALLYLDLDRFKHVNDTLGHDAGDELLVMVAERLKTCIRQGDTLARLGGDEFAILLYQGSSNEAQSVAERVVELLRSPVILRGQRVRLGVSVGIACYPEHGGNLVELLKAADIAMYQAKHTGGGWAFFDLQRNPYNAERMGLENALYQAIHGRELQLHYQPIYNLKTRQIEGCEGLARWYMNDVWIPPWSFIQVAEDSNLIFDLDMLVVETGLEQLKAWKSELSKIRISLNLSSLSLDHAELPRRIAKALERLGLPPHCLTLEITETAAIDNPQATYKVLSDLKALGVRIALDDFGNGYASLAYLRYLPIDQLKIDRSLIQHVGSGSQDEKLVLAAIMMGKSLGLEVVAEGVESQQQMDWLMAQGCDYAQGYWIGKPMEIAKLSDLLGKATTSSF